MSSERQKEQKLQAEQNPQAAGLSLLYDSAVTAGWTEGMAHIVLSVLDGLPIASKPDVLEVGCGSGLVTRTLREYLTHANVVGLDLNPEALSVAAVYEPDAPQLLLGNLLSLPLADNSIDLLLALDSFDQVGIPLHEALNEAKRVLRSDGILIVRVSAYPWLLGAHDVTFGTGRRYDRDEVELALAATGLRVVRSTHANTLLAPPVVAMRMAQKWLDESKIEPGTEGDAAGNATDEVGGIYASTLANLVVGAALRTESELIRFVDAPFGLSLIVAAQKA